MAKIQQIVAIIIIVVAVWLIIAGAYLAFASSKATSKDSDPNADLSKGEKQGAIALSVIQIIVGVILGVYAVILLLPSETAGKVGRALRFRSDRSSVATTSNDDY